jgi:hypothetical protein
VVVVFWIEDLLKQVCDLGAFFELCHPDIAWEVGRQFNLEECSTIGDDNAAALEFVCHGAEQFEHAVILTLAELEDDVVLVDAAPVFAWQVDGECVRSVVLRCEDAEGHWALDLKLEARSLEFGLKCGHVEWGGVAWFRQAETEKVDFSALECASRRGVTTGTEKSRSWERVG